MKRVATILCIFIGMAAVWLSACSRDHDPMSDNNDTPRYGRDEILVATIDGSDAPDTRVVKSGLDNWSFTRFSDITDVIGFYSLYGNLDAEDGNGPFYNAPMEFAREEAGKQPDDRYWKGFFRPLDMNYDIALIKNDVLSTFVYFPYCENMLDEGMELRILGEDGIYRCVDALAMAKITDDEESVMNGSFSHTFSEIIIIRGYGFDHPKEGLESIKVVTTKPYSHAEVVDNTNEGHTNWKILKPVYKESYTTLTEQQCREWEAWAGADYIDDNDQAHPAKYVIIPTAISSDRSTVNYVELYDNNGTLHRVTTFGLMNATDKRVSPNERYWLTVKLEGLVPTIFPFSITPWEQPQSYTEQRARGINTAEEFLSFVMAYNTYNQNNRNEAYEDDLKNFGDRYDVAGDVRWHFHINNDFDLSGLSTTAGQLNIPRLCDTLDGRTKTLYGITANKAFITELQSKGCIRNLNIAGLTVTSTTGAAAGGLIESMTGGLITGCNVDGYLNADGAAGLAVGRITAGTISNSSFSGLVVGASSLDDEGLVGEAPDGIMPGMIKDVRTSSLIFQTEN